MSNSSPTLDQLKKALVIAEQIKKLEADLASILGGQPVAAAASAAAKAAPSKPGKKRRTMSPEARARIVAAQKARWAKIRGEKAPAPAAAKPDAAAKPAAKAKGKAKRNISPEARAKMAAAAKRRWASVKKGK